MFFMAYSESGYLVQAYDSSRQTSKKPVAGRIEHAQIRAKPAATMGQIISPGLLPMHVQARCRLRVALTLSFASLLAACSSIGETTRNAMSAITPYKVEVVQGNFVSREQVQALQPGMSRQHVREILGTPLVTSVFHANRWEYVFTIKRQGVQEQSRKLTVFFEDDRFVRAEGDEMPSEAEFVATLGKPTGKIKVPNLQASEEQLAKFPAAKNKTEEAEEETPAQPQRSYPPLEAY